MSSSTTISNICAKLSLDSCGLQNSSEEGFKNAKASQKPSGPKRCKYNQKKGQSWRVSNVSIEFDVNPANLIKFREDVESKEILVADTKAGLDFLKGLPLLFVDERDVRNLECHSLEKMLTCHSLPLVLRFGFLPKLRPISFKGTLGNTDNWSKECKKRAENINELVTTERNYIRGLEELNNRFFLPYMKPLKEKADVDIENFQKRVESLIKLHNDVHDQFLKAENICLPFQKELQFLRMYKQYIREYHETLQKLKGAQRKRSVRSIFQYGLGTSDPAQYFDARAVSIVKRPTLYELLLRTLKKNTPIRHPMYSDLEKALIQVEGICYELNDFQHRADNDIRFSQIAKLIDPQMLWDRGVEKLIISTRRLIHDGKVFLRVLKPRKSRNDCDEILDLEEGFVVMCNDIIIITYQEYRVRRVFDVKSMTAVVTKKPKRSSKKPKEVYEVLLKKRSERRKEETDVEDNKENTTREFVRSNAKTGLIDRHYIYTETLKEAEEWEKSLRYARMVHIN